ncbi:MAG: ABC transporter ATP-binding protein [Crocinitomicaceae bacterium]|nr:ABC transporter ATP-binding protein [Crocinitomicaceae bacterium]
MNKYLFELENLSCSYTGKAEDKVLYIHDLKIPKGELIFLLGASGSGKSTLLETLGLMNNTIAEGSIIFYYDENKVRYEDLWYNKDASGLSALRKKCFSFIFQNTNLMENFTAYENICLAPMIQEGEGQEKTMSEAEVLMTKVNLPPPVVSTDALSMNLSGGQRQRVAFVRALISKYTVLFGDEPTGNLDEGNAKDLMNLLGEAISPESSVIIVSHDINLAMAHATMIICFSKSENGDYSEIRPGDVFFRRDWEGKNDPERLKFRQKLLAYYEKVTDRKKGPLIKDESKKAGLSKNFQSLFFKKEGKALSGKRRINLAILSVLLTVTFLAIGFANGSLEYLNEKMNNAFVNWVTISIPWSKSGSGSGLDEVILKLNDASVRSQFDIKTVTPYFEERFPFWNEKEQRFLKTRSRTFNPGQDILLTDILDDKNRVYGRKEGFSSDQDFGLIVTTRFLEEFGYPENASFVQLGFFVKDSVESKTIRVPVPVVAIVKEIPGKVLIACTEYFKNAYRQAVDNTFDIRHKPELIFVLEGNAAEAKSFATELKSFFEVHNEYAQWEPEVEAPKPYTAGFQPGFTTTVTFFPPIDSVGLMDTIAAQVLRSSAMQPFHNQLRRAYNFSAFSENFVSTLSYDGLSINFHSLDKVREFSQYVFVNFNEEGDSSFIEVDTGKVREKENFNFMSKVALVISWLVIIFGTLGIGLFLFHLLKMHLGKVRMNIGTFKAFGLGNSEAQRIYFMIILRFLLICLLISLLAADGGGRALNYLFQQTMVIEKGNYFELIHLNTAITLVVVLVSAIFISWITIRSMLNKTPGDLIYGRE